jgi:hypothetical protein
MQPPFHFISAVAFLAVLCPATAQLPESYAGTPYGGKAQVIPGRVELTLFDEGGEGVAYHDTEAVNLGAEFNHRPKQQEKAVGVADTIKFFRADEGVDITFTKHWVDFEDANLVMPGVNQNYIGWQADGEWTNYTIDVKVPGKYRIVALYGNKDNGSELWLNGTFVSALVLPVNTGYWHHWNKAVVGVVELPNAGLNLLTLNYNEGASLAYLDFILLP